MNISIPLPPSAGYTLATFALTGEQDVVFLRRQTRALAEEFSLPERDVRRFSAAAYEVGHLFYSIAGAGEAQLSLADGPTLQMTVRTSAINLDGTRRAIHSAVEDLRGLVHRLTVEDTEGGMAVSLSLQFPEGRESQVPSRAASTAPSARPGTDGGADLAAANAALQQSLGELHVELQETNRGVVALYAELDDQAERVRQAEDRLRVLLDGVQDYAICMLDGAGEITSWNVGAQRLFEYAPEEIIGGSVAAFYTPGERALGVPMQDLTLALQNGRLECEGLRVRKGGGTFDAHMLLTPLQANGRMRGYSLVVRDITERKRLEDDLRQRAEDLAAANRAKEDFLATLSHELRTPLNAMLGWARLLRTGRLDGAAQQRALETIERNAHIQEQLIADILDVSRIVTGKLRLDLRPLALEPVLDAAIDAVRPTADAKGVALSYRMTFVGTVLGDPDRLQQVVWNLLSNAIKFTPPGGRVQVDVAPSGPNAVITVTDTGEGITADLLPLVFDRFMQGDGSVTRMHGGLGLGLSIVRHLVELHGGQVHASSEGTGTGATFTVSLPVRAVQAPSPEHESDVQPALRGVKVLVVDDDPDARQVVSCALAQCGARTAAAGSAREALQLLSDFRPDVLVSDLGMPGEDGYALIQRVRSLSATGLAEVPAVALTGLAESENRGRALDAGYQEFVPKPVEADALAAVVRSLAHNKHH